MKLSKTQQRIVELMGNGWELGVSMVSEGRCWIQEGLVGHGGRRENVSVATFHALRKRGVIVQREQKFPTAKYVLSDEWK